MRWVLDTNAVIYLQKGIVADPLPAGQYYVSIITEIELMSFPSLTPDQENILRDFLNDVRIVSIDDNVKTETIRLRRSERLRLPDAIVAATAVALDAELISNDESFRGVARLRSRTLALTGT